MTRRACLIAAAGIALTASAAAQDVTFGKSKIDDEQGKERKVDLIFEGSRKTIVVRQKGAAIAFVPYAAIERLSYAYSQRRRVKEAGEVIESAALCGGVSCILEIPMSVVAGSIFMATKTKSHWFYVDYTDVNGPRELVLRLDKSEYQNVLEAARTQTGKDVQILPELCVSGGVKIRC